MYLVDGGSYYWIVKQTALFITNFLLSTCPEIVPTVRMDSTGLLFTIGVSGGSGGSDGSDRSVRSSGSNSFNRI